MRAAVASLLVLAQGLCEGPERSAPPAARTAEPVAAEPSPAAPASLVDRLAKLGRCYARGQEMRLPCFQPRAVVAVDAERRVAVETETLRAPDAAALEELAGAWRRPVPEDLRAVLGRWDGGTLRRGGSVMILLGARDALEHVEDSALADLPGFRIFATDGGGAFYALTPDGVEIVPMGAPDVHFRVGRSFTEVAERVLAGVDLHDRAR